MHGASWGVRGKCRHHKANTTKGVPCIYSCLRVPVAAFPTRAQRCQLAIAAGVAVAARVEDRLDPVAHGAGLSRLIQIATAIAAAVIRRNGALNQCGRVQLRQGFGFRFGWRGAIGAGAGTASIGGAAGAPGCVSGGGAASTAAGTAALTGSGVCVLRFAAGVPDGVPDGVDVRPSQKIPDASNSSANAIATHFMSPSPQTPLFV